MQCFKCQHRMEVQDTKNYKSFDNNKDVKEPKNNNYDQRWHWCPNCGSTVQSAAKAIQGTFVEGLYDDYANNLPLFNKPIDLKNTDKN